ncbi:MAG TPA: DUF2961 domain-containing protein [bacterium]|nr:DUF2961 domain-containing protein [bacterium]
MSRFKQHFAAIALVGIAAFLGLPGCADPAPPPGGPVRGQAAPPAPVLQAFDFMQQLPVLHDLVLCRNLAAHDKKGGNDNGFSNKAEFVRKGKGISVVALDMAGPGCVFSMAALWMDHPVLHPDWLERMQTRLLGNVKFFFDDENEPRINTPLKDLIGPAPFSSPFCFTADQSAGAYVSYVPLPFQDGLRVTVDGGRLPMWDLEFWYHSYPAGTALPSWTRMDLSSAAAALDPETAWQPAGPVIREVEDLAIGPGETREFFRSDTGGTIKCIRMRLPEDDDVLKTMMLEAWWDDDREPSLAVPLSMFFAVENRFSKTEMAINDHAAMRGVIVGQDREGLFFLRLPMPFARSARLALENRGPAAATIALARVESDGRVVPGLGRSAGYLRARFRESHQLTPGADYHAAEIRGRGQIVGIVLAVADTNETFLEGDERIYADGSRSPLAMGEGTETYFYGNWYFLESAFALPLHGAPVFRMKTREYGDRADVTMYRFHVTDFIPFRSGARFSIQHGGFNEVAGNYRSLVFYYHLPEPGMARTDYFSVADAAGLEAHGFSGTPARTRLRDGFFEGEKNGQDLGLKKRPDWISPMVWTALMTARGNFHDPPDDSPDRVSFIVAEHEAPYEFTARIDPAAEAVMLRRVLDQSVFDQKATVEVDGRPAATWFNTGNNKWKIFAEDDLILDPAATRGKDKITLRIVPRSKIFTAAEYTVFSIVLPGRE